MKTQIVVALIASSVASMAAALEPMPPQLEIELALSAAPPPLREHATVYVLDPEKGYELSRQGGSGVACLVQRTQSELGEFRDDLYVPLCYDAAGASTYLKMIMDTAALRARGMDARTVKAEIEKRWATGIYRVPAKPGLSYMVAPIMRTIGPPDLKVRTMSMPHLMFYAPHATNEDIGAKPDLADHASLLYPFVDRQGNAEHSYFIQLIGAAEKAQILRDEKSLLAALCAYRDVLCLTHIH